MTNELIMNVTPGETRIARLDEGVLAELYIERSADQQVVGNIYKGIINRVLPGMQAAFLDIGLEKAAFLYVSDVVSDLFESTEEEEDEEEGDRPSYRPRRRRGPLPKIENVLREGDSLVVQVAKEPMRTKGARISCHLSFPGRYVVYMPTIEHVGVSRRVGSYTERMRLKDIITKNKDSKGGFIARTVSAGATEESVIADINNLKEIWADISKKQERAKPPSLLYQDYALVLRSVRDLMAPEIDHLIIDSEEDYQEVLKFMSKFMPELAHRVEFYNKEIPLFDVYGVETEINRALGKKVWLKSGGYLIIDQSEALTSIDVNTGRFVGRDSFEDTILQTNLEAVDEIAYQLRLRNIGGIIIIDFIDMERYGNRNRVFHSLREVLRRDRVKTTMTKISELGLVEMTRKRTRDSLTQTLSESCVTCQGRGHVKTPTTVAFELFRELKRSFAHINGRGIVVNTHPRVAQVLFNEARDRLDRMEQRFKKRIIIEPTESLNVERFEISTRG